VLLSVGLIPFSWEVTQLLQNIFARTGQDPFLQRIPSLPAITGKKKKKKKKIKDFISC